MTESQLDAVYTALCRTMTRLGEPAAPLFLARFALLAIERLDDAALAQRLIDDAAADLPRPAASPAAPASAAA